MMQPPTTINECQQRLTAWQMGKLAAIKARYPQSGDAAFAAILGTQAVHDAGIVVGQARDAGDLPGMIQAGTQLCQVIEARLAREYDG